MVGTTSSFPTTTTPTCTTSTTTPNGDATPISWNGGTPCNTQLSTSSKTRTKQRDEGGERGTSSQGIIHKYFKHKGCSITALSGNGGQKIHHQLSSSSIQMFHAVVLSPSLRRSQFPPMGNTSNPSTTLPQAPMNNLTSFVI